MAHSNNIKRSLTVFEERSRVRVAGLASTFYGYFDEIVSVRAALEGDATSSQYLGPRHKASELLASNIMTSNQGLVSAVAFLKEVDRVHVDVLQLELGRDYPNHPAFRLFTFGQTGFVPLAAAN